MTLIGMKAKCVMFNGSHGTDEEQLNRIMDYQQDGTKFFHIGSIIPVADRGIIYFWIYYSGKFPDKKVWEEKNEN